MRRLLLLLALPALGCIEDRLSVEITTEIRADGSCHRKVVYRLERTDTAKPQERLPIPEADDPLVKLHRFPKGPEWAFSRDDQGGVEIVSVQADLPSPNAISGGDYVRVRHPKARPARNDISFALETSEGAQLYEYREIFHDPASPTVAARQLARALVKKDGVFSHEFLSRVDEPRPKRSDVKRVYRDAFALPLLRATTALASRRAFGLRERQQLDTLFEDKNFGPALSEALSALLRGADPDKVRAASDQSLEALMPALESEMAAAGLPMDALFPSLQETRSPIHFVAHLVMPAPITRANTCVNGNEATWEFDGDDLYGRGFEMWAKAAAEP